MLKKKTGTSFESVFYFHESVGQYFSKLILNILNVIQKTGTNL